MSDRHAGWELDEEAAITGPERPHRLSLSIGGRALASGDIDAVRGELGTSAKFQETRLPALCLLERAPISR
jgi:hypothetical protein